MDPVALVGAKLWRARLTRWREARFLRRMKEAEEARRDRDEARRDRDAAEALIEKGLDRLFGR